MSKISDWKEKFKKEEHKIWRYFVPAIVGVLFVVVIILMIVFK